MATGEPETKISLEGSASKAVGANDVRYNIEEFGTMVPLNKIEPDANQTRKEFSEAGINALAESISKDGLITPILVAATDASEGKYKIVDGERRYKALLKLAEAHPDKEEFQLIPVTITKGDVTIEGLLANMARLQYNPMEFAEALEQIKNRDNLNDGQLGNLIGKSRSGITEYLSLLKLPKEIRDAAKKESFVPFRYLKRLVAMAISDEEKITKYNELHEKHRHKAPDKEKRANSKSACTADRIAKGLQKKVDALAEKFDGFNVNEIKDSQQKVELKKSLEAIMRKAAEMVKLLGE